jgi:hypothetical protein
MSNVENSTNGQNENVKLKGVEMPEGVSVQLTQDIPRSKQYPEFYRIKVSHQTYATITYLDRKVEVDCAGEMRLTLPTLVNGELSDQIPTFINYSDELLAAGIENDAQLEKYLETIGNSNPLWEMHHTNPWWEVVVQTEEAGEIYDTFYEALDAGIEYISDDANWG